MLRHRRIIAAAIPFYGSYRSCPMRRWKPSPAALAPATPATVSLRFLSSSNTVEFEEAWRDAVVNAVSKGDRGETTSLVDAQAALPREVRDGIASRYSSPHYLAMFIRDHMKDKIQFMSEDNLFHSRIRMRPPKNHSAGQAPAPGTPMKRPPLPAKPTFEAALHDSPASHTNARPRSVIEILDRLVDYLPTTFVQSSVIAAKLPSAIQELYADTNFIFFMKRFRHYVDIRTQHGNSELRLKVDFSHPRRGKGDYLYSHSYPEAGNMIRRAPRNSEANLVGFLAPRVPNDYTPLSSVLSEISDIVSRHPAFDPRLGVVGLLEKYPDYFQFKDGLVRSRPYRSAPNSLDDCDETNSPEVPMFSKLHNAVKAAAEGKNYASEKDAAAVPTGKLYALLTKQEKILIKEKYRSFPRFLRLHGKAIVVTPNSMKVYQFKPEYEACADTLLDLKLRENKLSPDDPVLKIPTAIADTVQVDWAVKEFYDALPLMQCAGLQDMLTIVSPSVRDGLPQSEEELKDLLLAFPDYFSVWAYPDDPSILIVQRAKVETPSFTKDELVGLVLPLVTGDQAVPIALLLRRVPLPLQRCFYRNGLAATLQLISDYVELKDGKVYRKAV